jgi:BirA family transcriptional regulator, biotin operon repressor / biotin---[acetyl-CoA-carboxylase] ligase
VTTTVALSAIEAIASMTGVSVSVKWPNDLVVNSGKLAGILAESIFDDDARVAPGALCVGIGINLSWPPGFLENIDEKSGGLLGEATTVEEATGLCVERDVLVAEFLAALERRYRSLADGKGQIDTMERYREVCATIGMLVRVEETNATWQGEVMGIAPDGRLLVQRDDAVVALDAADVVHLRPAP